jgi:hypothetical protein
LKSDDRTLPSAEINAAEEPTPFSDDGIHVKALGQDTEEHTSDIPDDSAQKLNKSFANTNFNTNFIYKNITPLKCIVNANLINGENITLLHPPFC